MKTGLDRFFRLAAVTVLVASVIPAWGADTTDTPQPLVATYDSLADTILGAKQTEWNLVHAILASTYGHAEATFGVITTKLQSGQDARAEIERLADYVAQIGNEGDAAIAAVRKRLLDGGHHHHAGGEEKGTYDEGFIIVTRAARKVFLDAANAIAKQGGKADLGALETEWNTARKEFRALHDQTGM